MSQNIRTAHLEIENTFLEQNTFNKKTRFIEGVDAPFEVSSSTVVQRLNADMVDGIEGTTITDGINNLQTQINNLDIEGKVDDKVGDLNSLIVSEKSTAVAAINELQYQINALDPEGGSGVDKVGDLTTLNTIDKTNVVKAINEVNGKEYSYGDPVSEFENFDPINAQFLGGNAPEYYASQLSLTNGLNTKVDKTSIINDLTTGGIANVLSAQQGVELNSAIGQLAKFNRILTSSDNLFLLTGDKYTIYKIEVETPLNTPISNLIYSIVEFIPFGISGQRKLVVTNYGQSNIIGKKWEITLQPNGIPYQTWKEVMKTDNFTPTSQPLVVGSGFEAQTGASPFNVTKSGQMLYFIGQLKCLANTSASPVVLATSPLIPRGFFNLNIVVNGVRQEGLAIAPGTGQIYIYKPFSANDIINFYGFAIGDI